MKEAILAHIEKAMLAICVALMGMFLYMSFSLKSYDRKPEDFSKVANDARKRVTENEPQVDDLKPGNFAEASEALTKPIVDQFPTKQGWVRAFDFGTVFRNSPRILQPNKPHVQDNRGLMGQFLTDATGKRIVRKVKKGDAAFQAKNRRLGGGMGRGMGIGGDDDEEGYGGPSRGNMLGRGAFGGRGMFGGNEDMGGNGREGGFGLGENFEDGMGAGAGAQPGQPGGVGERKARIVLGEQIIRKKAKDGKDDKKKKVEKDDTIVSEPVLSMVGRRWVEIVASFPHAEQIKEFVKALREPAPYVGLRYDMAIVERSDLESDLTRSEWKPIDLEKQYRVIDNAYAFQPEPFPQVTIKGLAMNIPLLQTQFKNFLTLPEFEEPKRATYAVEFTDMTINAPKRTHLSDRLKNAPKKTGKGKASDKVSVTRRLRKGYGKEDLSKPKGQDEKGKAEDDRNVFNNRHEVEMAMIRFFDFTVDPGRRYRYRVAVQTYNPNYLRNDVASGDISTRPVLTGPPSEPSDDVVVEQDVHWYVLKQDSRNVDNLRAKLEVHFWDDKMGEWLVSEFQHRLGEYIGVSGAKRIIKKVRFDSATLTWKLTNESSEQDFNAHAIMLDMRGGRVRKGDAEKGIVFNVPREVIAVNQYGDLVRRDQDADVSNEVRKAVAANYKAMVLELEAADKPGGRNNNVPGGGIGIGGDEEEQRGRGRGRGARGGGGSGGLGPSG